jgi:hypothetical protein
MGFKITDEKGIEHEFHQAVILANAKGPTRIQFPSPPPAKMSVVIRAPVNQMLVPQLDYTVDGNVLVLMRAIPPKSVLAFVNLEDGSLFWAFDIRSGPVS